MKHVALSDQDIKNDLFPFSLIRHVADIRIGILTIREKWELFLGQKVSLVSEIVKTSSNNISIPANILPSKELISKLIHSKSDESFFDFPKDNIVRYPWNIFQLNDRAIREDFELLVTNRASEKIPATVRVTNPVDIFIEEGAVLSHCILNASRGPIYIGKNSEIMEGVSIRGPFALCEGAVVKMGTTIYGATTIGPYSVVGGEIKNSVIFGYSNKAHEGYLGDAVLGEWCNLGAGTSNSNLKNNLGEIKVYNPFSANWNNTGVKCGLFLGDYSRSAINTSFNSGTIVGVCCNIFGYGLTPTYIPNFSWGYSPIQKYQLEKVLKDIINWRKLKNKSLGEEEIIRLTDIYNQT